jgi:hypothetical protein
VVSSNASVASNVQIGAAATLAQAVPALDTYALVALMLLLVVIAARNGPLSPSPHPRRSSNVAQGDSHRVEN